MSEALITPAILVWARERAKLNIQEFSTKISQPLDKIMQWESGESRPTFIQAQKIAHILHIPFGYLFLKTPPIEEDTIPDLRTLNDMMVEDFSIDLKEVIKNAQRKQDWYRDFLKDNGHETLPFIGRFTIKNSTSEIINDINTTLGLDLHNRNKATNWETFLRLLINKVEDSGIWVMRNSHVGNNTRRSLKVEEFRGFVLCDDFAPLIYINSADAKAAQVFTLIHEITHLWLGESGISNVCLTTNDKNIMNKIEKKCNEVAAELLVPSVELRNRWSSNHPIIESIGLSSNYFKVSKVVIARRALDLKLLTSDDFFAFYHEQQKVWNSLNKKQKETPGGPSFYTLLPIMNGKKFTEAVVHSVLTQQTLIRYGARLLGVKPDKIDKVAFELVIA